MTIHQDERLASDAQIETASSDDYRDISGQLQLRMLFFEERPGPELSSRAAPRTPQQTGGAARAAVSRG